MTAPKRTGSPATEPVTLADAKAHLRVDGTDEDAYITGLIGVARVAAEERLERTLVSTTWRLTLDGFPDAIKLTMPPIVSVQSLTYWDATGVQQTLAPADYVLDAVSEPGYLVPAPGKAWPSTQSGRVNTVTVDYTAGYGATAADVPPPIRHWILLAIGDLYAQRERSAERPVVAQNFADGLLDTYKMWGV